MGGLVDAPAAPAHRSSHHISHRSSHRSSHHTSHHLPSGRVVRTDAADSELCLDLLLVATHHARQPLHAHVLAVDRIHGCRVVGMQLPRLELMVQEAHAPVVGPAVSHDGVVLALETGEAREAR